MSQTLPPLNALRAFESAARLESFSAAANELFVTHGAVSKQIKQLEEWLGVQLFDRTGGRVKLTDTGWRYLVQVQDGFDLIANATAQLKEPTRQRRLVINSTPTLAMHWLLPHMAEFQQQYPDVELRLMTSDRDIGRLDAPFDIAIRRGPGDWPGYIAKPFLEERELPLCSPALLKRLPLLRPADLANHTLLYADTRPAAWQRWLTLAGVPELKPAATQQFDHFYLALQAAMDGLGITLGPLPMMQGEIDAGRLVVPLAGPVAPLRGYCWIVPRLAMDDPAIGAFCQWLEDVAARLQGGGLRMST
ncbi:LysR family transcriptional regulator, glycine cleavage system transcriptional activator [Andreprevotia lacus DSM 23236]|jgi:LysR family glycine cleavage system transcriptional activator|uniref:LysR family transcriptional regulator, glycine cleavage system transcriptional activator n=1 Tax=Andreprevotia lacus DSM 23236 TaxID=1121001 RepID=A0A1W1XJ15_9NEIS|nr:transcriptional regulator GcvA [Andreprevotia lacus]SMC23764.1 LysR family transcriptional regulator, glycine cleavage system transcriptional activator [Andreprevotia lacus DSM 23236]